MWIALSTALLLAATPQVAPVEAVKRALLDGDVPSALEHLDAAIKGGTPSLKLLGVSLRKGEAPGRRGPPFRLPPSLAPRWRAFEAAPHDREALTRLVSAAFEARRPDLASPAVFRALHAGAWREDDKAAAAQGGGVFPTAQLLRAYLYRAAERRDKEAILTLLGSAWRNLVMTTEIGPERGSLSLAECYGDSVDSRFWRNLRGVVLAAPTKRTDRWYLAAGDRCLAITQYDLGWIVATLRVPGIRRCPVERCDPASKEPPEGITYP